MPGDEQTHSACLSGSQVLFNPQGRLERAKTYLRANAEVTQLDLSACVYKHVGGLHI